MYSSELDIDCVKGVPDLMFKSYPSIGPHLNHHRSEKTIEYP